MVVPCNWWAWIVMGGKIIANLRFGAKVWPAAVESAATKSLLRR